MKIRKILLPFLTLGLVFGVVACNNNAGGNGGKGGSSSTQRLPSIKVSAADSLTSLDFGDSVQLSAKEGNNALDGVTWTSSDETVATVNATGLVTATQKAGTTTITAAKAGYNDGKITITVKKPEIIVQVESGTSEGNVVTFKESHNTDTEMVDAWPQNAVLTLTFTASKAGAYELHLFARAHGGYQSTSTDNVAETMEITVNETAVTLSGTVNGGAFTDYKIGETNLNSGANTMTVKNIATDMTTIDYFKLILK